MSDFSSGSCEAIDRGSRHLLEYLLSIVQVGDEKRAFPFQGQGLALLLKLGLLVSNQATGDTFSTVLGQFRPQRE